MEGRPSRPGEPPPRRRGGPFGWVVGAVPGLVGIAFVLIVLAVVLILLIS